MASYLLGEDVLRTQVTRGLDRRFTRRVNR